MNWLIVVWSQGSIDMVQMDKIASIRIYRNVGRNSVHINTVDRLKINFDFYKDKELLKLPALISYAVKGGFDVVIDLSEQKIFETRKGFIPKNSGEVKS
ncbi:MAG: hypothetical protein ACXQTR_05055 [Candidatus Methanospirareceae archaeon]